MSRRKTTPQESMYSGARWKGFYPDVYSRTTKPWQTKVGRRNREFASFANLLGLNTSFDDLHKRDGESPFLRNVRYMGNKQTVQRAQVTSRDGAKLLGARDTGTIPALPEQYHIEMWEGQAIEFNIEPENKMIVAATFKIRNKEGAMGRLRVFLKENHTSRPVCDGNIALEGVSKNEFVERTVRFISPMNAKDGLTLRLEVEGDIEPDACGDVAEGRKIWITASGYKNHLAAAYTSPNVNECMREEPYDWHEEPSIPCVTLTYSTGIPMKKGTSVCTKDGKFLVFPLKYGNDIQLWRFNVDTHAYTQIDTSAAPVDSRAEAVRFAQGLGKLYFVDGYSNLQRIDLSTWKSEVAICKQEDIDEQGVTPQDMQAQPGASLIIRINNRIWLAGFKEDPNFVQYSILNSLTGTPEAKTENAGVQYDQFSDISWFYSPDRSPKDALCGPITALANFEGKLVVFRTNGCSIWKPGNEFASPSMDDMYSYNIGVESQEDVTNLNGQLYIYNRSEGVRRFTGADATYQSVQIDNELRKLPYDSPRFLFGHANKIRLYCDLKGRGYADHNFIYFMMLANSSPWYCDDNTPVCWVVGDQNDDTIYAMHPLYPAIYEVDSEGQYTDFDSSITMQYHTAYKSPGETSGWTILHRVLLKLVASSTNIWYIGLDFNHEDNPAVWRKYVKQYEDDEEIPESVFENTAEAGTQTIDLMLRAKVRDFQVRVLVNCWRENAMLQYIEGQYGGVKAL
ncbi:MAG: hypothetical protein IIY21_25430 [Clostridiales bacterium]|nr:hypothetical protein [Clostridiales bacterium]